jgi:hypothetical protein
VAPGLPPGRETVGTLVTASAGYTGAGVARTVGAAAGGFAATVVTTATGAWARSARATVERVADAVALAEPDAEVDAEAAWPADAEALALRAADPELVPGLERLINCPLGDAATVVPASDELPSDEVRDTPATVPTATTIAPMETAQTGLLKRTACTRETPGLRTAYLRRIGRLPHGLDRPA